MLLSTVHIATTTPKGVPVLKGKNFKRGPVLNELTNNSPKWVMEPECQSIDLIQEVSHLHFYSW